MDHRGSVDGKNNPVVGLFNSKKAIMDFFQRYYPVTLAFLSLLVSVYLWFSGQREEGLFVGLWVPSILAFAIYIELVKAKAVR